jgi:D-alanyl-D-alanine carboxypeptidase
VAASLDSLDPRLADAARAFDAAVHDSGLQGRFSSTLRTRAEQTRLYARFVAGQNPFPVVPPGASAHEYGLAFDYVVSPWEYQEDAGALWVSWGGGWNKADSVHFELPGASDAAFQFYKSQLEAPGQTIGEWIDSVFGGIPWWVSLLTPFWSMTSTSTDQDQKNIIRKLKQWHILSRNWPNS